MADGLPEGFTIDPEGGDSGTPRGNLPPGFVMDEHPSYGPVESGVEGYLKGASANWRDEIYGASKASGLPDVLGGFRAPVGAARLAQEKNQGRIGFGGTYFGGHDREAPGGVTSLVTGDARGPVRKEYERARDEKRREEAEMQRQNPTAFGAGEVVGGVAGTLLMPEARAAAVPSFARNLGRAALAGGEYGALAGAGEGEGTADTAIRAGAGTVIGAGLGAAGNLAVEAASPVVGALARRWNAYRDPEDAGVRRIARSAEADANAGRMGMTAQDLALARTTGMPVAPVDVGGENMLSLARSAANTSPEARGALTDLARDRFLTQNTRIANFIRQQTGGGNATEDLERLTTMASTANRPAYRAAYAAGENGIWNDNLARMAGNSPAIRRAMENAVERGRDRATAEGYGAFNPGVTFENGIMEFGRGRGAPPYPNMQFWDYTQRELRDMATAAARTGHNEQAGALRSLHRQLLNELDQANPAFAQARQGAAQFFGAQNALEAGQNFARSSADIPGARRAIARMNGPERELFARGYASDLADQVERAGDNRNAVLHNAFNSVAGRERTRLALSPLRGQQLEAMVRLEMLGDRLHGALGNSTTARQLHELGMAGGDSILESGVNPFHMSVPGLARALFHRANQYIDERVSGAVGRMLASQDPVVHDRITRAIARNGAAMQNLRQLTRTMSQGVGRTIAGAGTEAFETSGERPKQGFKHGGVANRSRRKVQYRADGGSLDDDDDLARAMTPPPTAWTKYTPEINRKSGEVGDIIGNTVGIMAAPITNQAKRMQSAYEHGIDWGDPEQVGETSGRTLMDMMALAGGTAGAAERGTVGALGGKPITAYHGSPHDFNSFDTSKTNQGVWLAKDPDAASRYAYGKGNIYKVDIDAPIESFIDRSKPIDQQSESVRNVIEGIENDLGLTRRKGAAGGDFYADLARKLAGDGPHLQGLVKANDLLRERGIPGINDGDTQIVFDDKLLNITHKNGVPVAASAERGTVGALGGKPGATDRQMLTRAAQTRVDRAANELPLRNVGQPSAEALMNPAITSKRLEQSADTKAGREFQAAQDKADSVVSAWREAFKAHGEEIPAWLQTDPAEAMRQAEHFRTADNGIWLPDWFHEMLNGKHSRARGGRVPGELPAAQKASHEEVGYRSVSPRKKQHCRDCTKFIAAEQGGPACKKVAQPILQGAWCRRFVLK